MCWAQPALSVFYMIIKLILGEKSFTWWTVSPLVFRQKDKKKTGNMTSRATLDQVMWQNKKCIIFFKPLSIAWLPAIPPMSAVGLCRTGNHTTLSLSPSPPLTFPPSYSPSLFFHSPFPLSSIPLIPSRANRDTFSFYFFTRVLDMSHFVLLKDQTDWTSDYEIWYVMVLMWDIF